MHAKIIWFTGLSGSGKSTLSLALSKILKKKRYKIKIIDGDSFRKKSKNINKFTKKNIYLNNVSIIKYIAKIKKDYDYILVAVISPFLKTRSLSKKTFGRYYYEVFVNCSVKTLEKRDTKDLYRQVRNKFISNLIGYRSKIKYQKSKYSKININTDKNNVDSSLKIIIKKIF